MSRQPKLCPKSQMPGFLGALPEFSPTTSIPGFETFPGTVEVKEHNRIFRVKRKHVLKACDRCRVKKTKCDGNQPCNRCSTYNHPCLFRERKATQTKVYSRDFVEMLESQHSLVVKALQRLYKHCINNEGFPGEPLVDVADGHPLTHAILDRLGLIKQAEEGTDEHSESNEEPLQCLRQLSTSTDYTGTVEPSPEPASPRESREFGPEISPTAGDVCKWDLPSMRTEQHSAYPRCDYIGQVQHATTTDRLYQPPIVLSDASRCPDVYYQTDICNASSRPSHLHAGTVPWLGPYQGTVQPSIDTLSHYQLPLGQQPYLVDNVGLPSGWTYPTEH